MITDTQCRNAKPKDKPYKLADEKGLYLEVKPTGGKFFRYRLEVVSDGKRKESTFTIGQYGAAPIGETPEQAKIRRDRGVFTLAEASVGMRRRQHSQTHTLPFCRRGSVAQGGG